MSFKASNYLLVVASSLGVLAGCESINTVTDTTTDASGSIEAFACYDESDPQCSNVPPAGDPNPSARGYYLGPDFSFSNCTGGTGTDLDYDGIEDFCEFQLALAFRPMLSTSPTDPALGRESYWAVANNGNLLTVVYMFGYYEDAGVQNCGWSPPVGCTPHLGDNEWVITNLAFDSQSQHWSIASQIFSAHWGCVFGFVSCDYTEHLAWSNLEYPTADSSYSRVYVAHRKHANYATRAKCNSGAILNSDDCTSNAETGRFHVGLYRNIGSDFGRFIDATYSVEQPGTHPGVDYFWTDTQFCGWNVQAGGSRGGCAPTSYVDVLNAFLYAN